MISATIERNGVRVKQALIHLNHNKFNFHLKHCKNKIYF